MGFSVSVLQQRVSQVLDWKKVGGGNERSMNIPQESILIPNQRQRLRKLHRCLWVVRQSQFLSHLVFFFLKNNPFLLFKGRITTRTGRITSTSTRTCSSLKRRLKIRRPGGRRGIKVEMKGLEISFQMRGGGKGSLGCVGLG
jgi:hypothetical protein